MDRTEATIRKLFAALPAPGYDLGILSDEGMQRLEAVLASRLLQMLPYLKYRNATGAHMYTRPTGESLYTLLDDLSQATFARLAAEGYAPRCRRRNERRHVLENVADSLEVKKG